MQATLTKISSYQPTGEYKRTTIDDAKDKADFLLVQCSPYIIRWKGGNCERVNEQMLNSLQAKHPNWMTDF